MREEIADLVYPVINRGLHLKELVLNGEELPDIENEQAALKGLLGNEAAARRWTDFGGEGSSMDAGSMSIAGGMTRGGVDVSRRGGESFLGVRYTLACWLDEIFIDSPLEEHWREHTLEQALYGSRDRAWKFWKQADLAQARRGSDPLEVAFLCVMLGFRGEYRDDPDKLRSWVNVTQTRIAQSQAKEWPAPTGTDLETHVPPLRAREKMQRMILCWGAALLVVILVGTFALFKQFGQ
jgi:type VI secretion system protein ImpK